MATIGLDKLYYAKITEAADTGYETYGTPAAVAKPITANITIESNEASLFAGDGLDDFVREFKSGTISLNINELGNAVAADLLGMTVDQNGVLVSTAEDSAPWVAIAFRAKKSNGKYRYFWLYRVKFGVPGDSLTTKGDSITFSTPTIEGTITRRNKPDEGSKHPWKVDVTDGVTGVDATTIAGWFSSVYEPDYTT